MDGILTIGIILIGVILITWLFYSEYRKKHNVWNGVLENKKINKYFHRGEERTEYLLYFLKDSGGKVTYNASYDVYNSFETGDRAEKRKGEYYPVRIGL